MFFGASSCLPCHTRSLHAQHVSGLASGTRSCEPAWQMEPSNLQYTRFTEQAYPWSRAARAGAVDFGTDIEGPHTRHTPRPPRLRRPSRPPACCGWLHHNPMWLITLVARSCLEGLRPGMGLSAPRTDGWQSGQTVCSTASGASLLWLLYHAARGRDRKWLVQASFGCSAALDQQHCIDDVCDKPPTRKTNLVLQRLCCLCRTQSKSHTCEGCCMALGVAAPKVQACQILWQGCVGDGGEVHQLCPSQLEQAQVPAIPCTMRSGMHCV